MIDGYSLGMWAAGEMFKYLVVAVLVAGVIFGGIGFGIAWLFF